MGHRQLSGFVKGTPSLFSFLYLYNPDKTNFLKKLYHEKRKYRTAEQSRCR